MPPSFKELLNTQTSKDTLIVFAGTIVNITAGGLFFIIAPRVLGPSNYGLFSTILATGILANNISNFGIDTGILKFAKKNDKLFHNILSLAFKSYIYLGLGVAIVGFIISPLVAQLLGQGQLVNPLRIAFAANIFLLLTNFYVAALQSTGEFKKASIVTFSSNLARLLILIIATYFITIGLFQITILFFSVTLLSVIIGAIYFPIRFERIEKNDSINFFKYNFWVALSLIVPSIPFDNYLLVKISGPIQAGLYAAPFKILTFVYQLGGNFSRVLAPRFSSFENNLKAKQYAIKALPIISVLIIGLIFLILISRPLVLFLFWE